MLVNGRFFIEKMNQVMVGKCMSMCPKSELKDHQMPSSPFECNLRTGEFDPKLAIKMFHRSDAGNKVLPIDIRPLPALKQTLDHILDYVITQVTSATEDASELDMYLYVRDRFRAIRSDITIQFLSGAEVIEIYQKIALFFIWAGIKFYSYPNNLFESVLNMEQITQTLLSLEVQYQQYFEDNQQRHPLEYEFTALHLLVQLDSSDFLVKLMRYPNDIVLHPLIQSVIKLRTEYNRNNVPNFVQLLSEQPVQIVSLSLIKSQNLWAYSGLMMRKAFSSNFFAQGYFQNLLDISNHQIGDWDSCLNIKKKGDLQRFDVKSDIKISDLPSVFIPSSLVAMFANFECVSFMNMEQSDSNYIPVKVDVPVPTFTPIKQEVYEPEILNEPEEIIHEDNEEEEIYIPKPVTPVSSPKLPHIEKHKEIEKKTKDKPKQKPKQKLLKEKPKPKSKKQKHQITYSSLEICTMLPMVLPPLAYAQIIVNCSDGSTSANFAVERLNVKDDIIYCREYCDNESTLYISILRGASSMKIDNVGSILHCEEIIPLTETTIPSQTFNYKSSLSPYLTFDNALRACIETAMTPFQPLDITELLKATLSDVFDLISRTIWQSASANSVFNILNKALDLFADFITSDQFLKYVVPFIHDLLPRNAIEDYHNTILSLKLHKLSPKESQHPINGSTWPICVRENIYIALDPFVAPVSCLFNPQTLLDTIIEVLKPIEPEELIEVSDSIPTFESLMNGFEQELYNT